MLLPTLQKLQDSIPPQDSIEIVIAQKIENLKSLTWEDVSDRVIDSATSFGLRVLAAILLYIVGAWLIKRVRNILVKIFNNKKLDKSLTGFLISLVNVTLTVILFVVIVTTLGVPTSTFTALMAAGGLAIGMALSGTLQNFAGGVMILLFKPFKVGDFIDANGFSGTVHSIKITTTHIITPDNRLVILPNSSSSTGNIINYSTNPTRRAEWNISISYGDDVDLAKKVAMELLNGDTRVLQDPAPTAILSALRDSDIIITLRAWTKTGDYWDLISNINEKIYVEFPKNGLHFPYPQLDVTIKQQPQD